LSVAAGWSFLFPCASSYQCSHKKPYPRLHPRLLFPFVPPPFQKLHSTILVVSLYICTIYEYISQQGGDHCLSLARATPTEQQQQAAAAAAARSIIRSFINSATRAHTHRHTCRRAPSNLSPLPHPPSQVLILQETKTRKYSSPPLLPLPPPCATRPPLPLRPQANEKARPPHEAREKEEEAQG
jgi:hypothetical protein